jgi:hypothetical protein
MGEKPWLGTTPWEGVLSSLGRFPRPRFSCLDIYFCIRLVRSDAAAEQTGDDPSGYPVPEFKNGCGEMK